MISGVLIPNKLCSLLWGQNNMPRPLQVVTWTAIWSFPLGGRRTCQWYGSL